MLDAIYTLVKNYNMQFNSRKFKALHNKQTILKDMQTGYTCTEWIAISELKSVRDLGIDLRNDTSFLLHFANLVINWSRTTGWILPTYKSREKETLMDL